MATRPPSGSGVSIIIAKISVSIGLGLFIQGLVAVFGAHIEWWLAQIIAWVLVWGGIFIVIHGDDHDWFF